jgi:hypothetical protein
MPSFPFETLGDRGVHWDLEIARPPVTLLALVELMLP